MRENACVRLIGKKVVLVPYEAHHVPRYHMWMKSEELQKLTASEPLSLEEEYEMQRKWREDEDKCTFIVLDKEKYSSQKDGGEHADKEDAMEGDVNLFFNEGEDRTCAEIEIMIAEPSARGKGHGKEALLMMMRYGIEDLQVKTFVAKIGYSNAASLSMFKNLGFAEVSRSDVFEEVTLNLPVTDSVQKVIEAGTNTFERESTKR